MKHAAFHLNLMKESERRSSSPIRMRVMAPLFTLLACAAMIVWWGTLMTQLVMVKAQVRGIEDDVSAREKSHREIIDMQGHVRELTLELEQLGYYRDGVRKAGEPLAKLAEVMPLRVQLTELTMRPPPPQVLKLPGMKVPLFGPVTNSEPQQIVFAGRSTKDTPVMAMMESLDSPDFESLVTREKKVNSFKTEDTPAREGRRLFLFEVEYAMPERRFGR